MTEVRVLRHPSGAAIVPIHYSMDPERDTEWAVKAKAMADREEDWQKEQELDFRSVAGKAVYESYSRVANTRGDTDPDCPLYSPRLPLRLSCDFNVDPMSWVISQFKDGMVYVLDEIYQSPGSVISACAEFLKRYGDHEEEVWLYGDATGHARSQRDQRSNYEEIQLQFFDKLKLVFKVPRTNPSIINRVRSINRKLRDTQGQPHMLIHRTRCPELILDMEQVVWNAKGDGIHEVRNKADRYFYRGHMSASLGYFVSWEWPAYAELNRKKAEMAEQQGRRSGRPKPPPPKGKKKRLLGRFF